MGVVLLQEPVLARADARRRTSRRATTRRCDLTVVVPTRNERDNIAPLLQRLEAVRPELRIDVLFVDDSSDDTASVIAKLSQQSRRRVTVIHRPLGQRSGGLGGAVRAGLLAARSEFACVMDADLQHPPELLGALLDEARRSGADVVLASRYSQEGGVGEFSAVRVALSSASAFIAKSLFPRRLRTVSDPMSGFFLVRCAAIDAGALRPRGFKVLLEILLSNATLTTREVPFRFGERRFGDSKASLREGARYLRRLLELRLDGRAGRLAGVASVGALGVAVNSGMLSVLTRDAHVWYMLASVLATQVAILSNYALTEWVVFRAARPTKSLATRLGGYVLVNNGALLVSAPLLVGLVSLGIGLIAANVLTLLFLVVVRFAIADAYIWGSKSPLPRRTRRTAVTAS